MPCSGRQLKTWLESQRTAYGKLRKQGPSGSEKKYPTEKELWILKSFACCEPFIKRTCSLTSTKVGVAGINLCIFSSSSNKCFCFHMFEMWPFCFQLRQTPGPSTSQSAPRPSTSQSTPRPAMPALDEDDDSDVSSVSRSRPVHTPATPGSGGATPAACVSTRNTPKLFSCFRYPALCFPDAHNYFKLVYNLWSCVSYVAALRRPGRDCDLSETASGAPPPSGEDVVPEETPEVYGARLPRDGGYGGGRLPALQGRGDCRHGEVLSCCSSSSSSSSPPSGSSSSSSSPSSCHLLPASAIHSHVRVGLLLDQSGEDMGAYVQPDPWLGAGCAIDIDLDRQPKLLVIRTFTRPRPEPNAVVKLIFTRRAICSINSSSSLHQLYLKGLYTQN